MMFMMPMPPTSSDTPAMLASSAVIVCVASFRTLAISSMRAHHEVVGIARLNLVADAQRRRDPIGDGRHLARLRRPRP